MSNREIRLGYSGLIIFLARFLSIGTGLIFTLMVTRNITAETFGVYGNISDILTYFTLASGIFPFWAIRFISRNHAGSSITVVLTNLIITVPSAILYFIVLPIVMPLFRVSVGFVIVYVIISVQIFETYLQSAFDATLQAKKPQSLGFGIIIFESSKVCLGYALIMWLQLGLTGVVVSVILAIFIQLLYYLSLIFPIFNEKVNWNYVKEWIKASPFNLYGIVGQRLADSVLILLFLYGGKLARGYYQAAYTIASIVIYSSSIGSALYPRLLSKNRPEDITFSLKLVLMFAIPIAFGAIVMSDSYLTILGTEYSTVRPALTLLSIDMLILCFSSIFNTVVSGSEKLDAEAEIPWKRMIKSNLFFFLTLPYVQAAINLPIVYYLLNFMVTNAVDATTYVAFIILLVDIGLVNIRYFVARKSLLFKMPLKNIIKYIGAATTMALLLYVFPHPTRLVITVAFTLIGACVYFAVLSIIDSESKRIIKDAIKELSKIVKIHKSA